MYFLLKMLRAYRWNFCQDNADYVIRDAYPMSIGIWTNLTSIVLALAHELLSVSTQIAEFDGKLHGLVTKRANNFIYEDARLLYWRPFIFRFIGELLTC